MNRTGTRDAISYLTDLNVRGTDHLDLSCDTLDNIRVDAMIALPHQGLATELQQ